LGFFPDWERSIRKKETLLFGAVMRVLIFSLRSLRLGGCLVSHLA
jgi:hypothetical protein